MIIKERDILMQKCSCINPRIDRISIERYSYGLEIRKLAKYPSSFPLRINSHHGVYLWNKPHAHEFDTELPAMLIFNLRLLNSWKKETEKPAFLLPNPFILYRRRCEVEAETENKEGSIFFLSHSTNDIDADYDAMEIIGELKKLPIDFLPVKIALHFIDVEKNRHQFFLDNGYSCVSAGHMYNTDFVKNFYNELKSVKYALSNTIGSHTFYSIDLGIPFSLIGKEPLYIFPETLILQNLENGRNLNLIVDIKKLIGNNLNYEISNDLLKFVRTELGVDIKVSSLNLFFFLLSNTIKYYFKKAILIFFKTSKIL